MAQMRTLRTLDDTRKLAETIGQRLRCGDVVTLAGDLGAGKTSFAQFLIHSLSREAVEVTSPTFTLLQTYPVTLADGTDCELYHYDLYRIDHEGALTELGIDEALAQVSLIEWPERLGAYPIPVALAVSLTIADDGARHAILEGDARWSDV